MPAPSHALSELYHEKPPDQPLLSALPRRCDNMSVVLVIFKEAALPRASSSARMKRSKSSQNELSNSR